MSDIIQLLPDAVANQIAAGEVIQRPSSVVKEMMENAIDAGADRIQLLIKDSGKSLIQVIDNGCGMSPTDARMSFERHATSKLRQADDLQQLRTMGFRGEAMATIGAISQVELKTRKHADELGTRILLEGSEVKKQEPCQTAAGTSIAVKNLFYNVPARRNFLKSNSVEMRHILDEFQRIALAHPDLFFSLHHNGNKVFHLPEGKLRQRIVGIFGHNYNKRLVPAQEETDILEISGYVGKPEFAKKARGEQYFFINRRFIKSSYLNHAVQTAYEELIPSGVHPFYCLFLTIDPKRIDINVHPTKQEIKFDDEKLVYQYLKGAIRHALGQYSVTPTLDFQQSGSFSSTRIASQRGEPQVQTFKSGASAQVSNSGSGSRNESSPASTDKGRQSRNLSHWEELYRNLNKPGSEPGFPPKEDKENEEVIDGPIILTSKISDSKEGELTAGFRDHKPPYQIHQRYIVSSIKSGFLLIDQQAAHERVLYEKYLRTLRDQQAVAQRQLFASTIELTPTDAVLLTEMLPQLQQLGFDIEAFGQNAFVINGLPTEIAGKQNPDKVIDGLIEQYRAQLELKLDTTENLARAMARSAAIRRGQFLAVSEMQALINQLFACKQPERSPGGRACFLTYDLDELDEQFSK